MFPEEGDGEPKLQIIEHPKSRGFRFRYTCEGPSHGGIPGASSDKNKKTFPAVKIVNYQGYARIVVQLVTNEGNPRLHPHSLVGKQCQNGICTVQCGPKDMTATFPNLGIQHVTKKNVASILEERYIAAEMQLSSINDGFPQEVQRNIKDEDKKRIAAKAQSEAKSIDLSVVRLMFIAYLPDSQGAFTIMLKPIISDAIFDSKAPNAATLKICRMDCNAGSASGGDEVYLLCDKVQKDDIQVRFVEDDGRGNDVWENYGSFCPTDVHRQFAIVFKTPPYKDQNIQQPVNVNVQLRRKSDGEVSEPRSFTYLANKTDYDMIERKRRKVMPDYLDHLDGNNSQRGFNFSGGAGNSVGGNAGIQFGGSSGTSSDNVKKTPQLKVANLSRRHPQNGPVALAVLQRQFQTQSEQNIPAVCLLQNIPRCSSTHIIIPSPAGQPPVQAQRQPVELLPVSENTQTSVNNMAFDFESMLVDYSSSSISSSLSQARSGNSADEDQFTTNDTAARIGNDVGAFLNTSFASSSAEGTDLSFEPDNFNWKLFDDIETDGVLTDASSRKEFDFASALTESDADTISQIQSFDAVSKGYRDGDVENSCVSLLENLSIRQTNTNDSSCKAEKIGDLLDNQTPDAASGTRTFAQEMATAMHDYSTTGDVRTLLLRQRHLISTKNDQGDTVLHLAVIHNNLEALGSILDVVATLENRDEILNSVNDQQQTALQIASLSDNVDAVVLLLRAEADPLLPDLNGNHSIHVASRHGNADVLSRLLSQVQGQVVDTRNHNGLSCFHLAAKARKNATQCLNLLRSHCDVDCGDARSGRTALHLAVERGNLSVVSCLLMQCDADVNALTFDQTSPLDIALSSESVAIASLLIVSGADCGSLDWNEDDIVRFNEMCDNLQRNVSITKQESYSFITTASTYYNIALQKFCKLLNSEQTASNWLELADRLQLSHFKPSLNGSRNPTSSLLKLYWARQGTIDGLRSALMNIGRHDAVQILNQASHRKEKNGGPHFGWVSKARDATSPPIGVM